MADNGDPMLNTGYCDIVSIIFSANKKKSYTCISHLKLIHGFINIVLFNYTIAKSIKVKQKAK